MSSKEQDFFTNITTNNEDLAASDPSNFPVVQSIERPMVNQPEPAQNPTKYIGVVPQPNGHWGAQIYANNHRFWLGTFKSELEAAMAYDSAAVKLRTGDFHRNFPWTVHTVKEHNFQAQFSSEAILSMIRDGSYQPRFQEFMRHQQDKGKPVADVHMVYRDGEYTIVQLFEKELTPSDVGKLNRLVIPKKLAVKCLPCVPEDGDGAEGLDVELDLYDSRLMKSWNFRYSYWKSSQSYVFTKGWSRFVKEKNLKDKDVVMFYTCSSRFGNVLCIDVKYADSGSSSSSCPNTMLNDGRDDHQEAGRLQDGNVEGKKRLRLFGVWIEEGDASLNGLATNKS